MEYPVGNPAGTPVIPSSYGAASEHPGQNREISPRRLADAWYDLQNASQPFYHLIQCYTVNSAANRHIYFTDFPAKNIFHLNRRSDLSGRTVNGVGLRPLTCWDCWFDSFRGHRCLPYLTVAFCQVEVSGQGRSLVRCSPTTCGVSECDREASIMRRPWPTGGCCAMGRGALKKPAYVVDRIRNTRRGSSETVGSVTLRCSFRVRNSKTVFKYDRLFRPVKARRYISLTRDVNQLAKF